jgi:hypothetical protein
VTAWKNWTFLAGLLILLAGAWTEYFPDWDAGLSLLMAGCTYLTADWVIGVLKDRRYAWWPLAAFYAWLSVDLVYWLYWEMVNPAVAIREGQWLASLCLYLLCGIIWKADPSAVLALLRRLASPAPSDPTPEPSERP